MGPDEEEIDRLQRRVLQLEAQIERERQFNVELQSEIDSVRSARDSLIEMLARKLDASPGRDV